jgi:hypothetical protein
MLSTGWLNYYQKGYLHRDISIGNVLRLKQATTMEPFKISVPILDDLMDVDPAPALTSDPHHALLDDNNMIMEVADGLAHLDLGAPLRIKLPQTIDVAGLFKRAQSEVSEYANRIEKALVQLGVTDRCSGILTDGDMAAEWEIYINNAHDSHTKSVSGGVHRHRILSLLTVVLGNTGIHVL